MKVRAVSSGQDHQLVSLCERDSEGSPQIITLLVICANIEWQSGVDSVARAGAILVVLFIIEDVDGTGASIITLTKDALLVSRLTHMVRAPEPILVSLHDVELGAGRCGTTPRPTVLEWVFNVVYSGHHNCIEGGEAPAAHLAHVDIVLEVASEQVRGEILRRIYRGAPRQVHLMVKVEGDGCVIGRSGSL